MKAKLNTFFKRTGIILVVALALYLIMGFVFFYGVVSDYNVQVDNYNSLVPEYNKIVKGVEVANIKDMPREIKKMNKIVNNPWGYTKLLFRLELPSKVKKRSKKLETDITNRLENVLVMEQINSPDEERVKDRISQVYFVTDIQSVTAENNPDGLLGKEGGYQSCAYFAVTSIDGSKIDGKDSIEKGTDGGGSIEVYDTLQKAQNRVDYLSEFDNTILNSGSYSIVGTMVIRLLYYLTEEQQFEMTNNITQVLTAIE